MKQGLHRGMKMEEYLAVDAVSHSDLKNMKRSPAKCLAERGFVTPSTDAMVLGSAIHTAVLEPERFDDVVGVLPGDFNGRTKAGKALKEQMEGQYPIVLKKEDANRALAIRDSVWRNSDARVLLDAKGSIESTILVQDPVTGVMTRSRPDKWCWAERIIVDLKKTVKTSVSAFLRQAYDLGYFSQIAFYKATARWLAEAGLVAIEPPTMGVLLAVVDSRPYENALIPVPTDVLMKETEKWRALLDLYATCVEENRWPGWPTVVSPDFPGWIKKEYNL